MADATQSPLAEDKEFDAALKLVGRLLKDGRARVFITPAGEVEFEIDRGAAEAALPAGKPTARQARGIISRDISLLMWNALSSARPARGVEVLYAPGDPPEEEVSRWKDRLGRVREALITPGIQGYFATKTRGLLPALASVHWEVVRVERTGARGEALSRVVLLALEHASPQADGPPTFPPGMFVGVFDERPQKVTVACHAMDLRKIAADLERALSALEEAEGVEPDGSAG